MNPYEFLIPEFGITFRADRLRRERHELFGELLVLCDLPGSRTINGNTLSVGDFNFSSVRARQDRAKLLGIRAASNGKLDWYAYLEDFCQRILMAEREGDPAVDLRTVTRPAPDDDFYLDGLVLPRRHPSILFGDGGTGKSYIALWTAGRLVAQGYTVALFDWELDSENHRDRLERLFPVMPKVLYARCEAPITQELDRLRKVVTDHKVDYAIYDSIAFACNGRPEDAEIAGQYFRAVRSIGCGSLHIAHINKSEDSDKKPFGSSFWYNGARMIWYAQAAERADEHDPLRVGLFNRKCNLGSLKAPVSFTLTFSPSQTLFQRANLSDSPDLAVKLSIRQRMTFMLKRGSMEINEIADELDADPQTVQRTVRRYRDQFVLLDSGRVGLCAIGR